jgi:hypothetical protein
VPWYFPVKKVPSIEKMDLMCLIASTHWSKHQNACWNTCQPFNSTFGMGKYS